MAKMILKSALEAFEMYLGEPENKLSQFWASYRDQDSNGNWSAPQTVRGNSNGLSPVTRFTGAAVTGTVRQMVQFAWSNIDTGPHNFAFQLNSNGTLYVEPGLDPVQSNQSVQWEIERGWYLFPSAAAMATVPAGSFYGGPLLPPGVPPSGLPGLPAPSPGTPSFLQDPYQSLWPFGGQLAAPPPGSPAPSPEGQLLMVRNQQIISVNRFSCGRWS